MTTYISLLRGINVSGRNMIKMPELVRALEKRGLTGVKTYIQSGNIVFRYRKTESIELAHTIEKIISEAFGLTVAVLVLTAEELSAVVSGNPFLKIPGIDTEKLHVTFLFEMPSDEAVEKLFSYSNPPDEMMISGIGVYLYLPGGYGRTKFNNGFFENKLGMFATTRNWRTCLTLNEMSL